MIEPSPRPPADRDGRTAEAPSVLHPDPSQGSRPAVILVGGIDPTGMAGLARDLDTCARFDIHGCPVPSGTTVQTSAGVHHIEPTPPDLLAQMIDAAVAETDARWLKVGALFSSEQAEAVVGVVRRHDLQAVVDPVLRSTSGTPFMAAGDLAPLLEVAVLATPNEDEAAAIGDAPCPLLVTGGGTRPDLLDGAPLPPAGDPVPGSHRGTGCRLATAITCGLASGLAVADAVAGARRWLHGRLVADNAGADLDAVRARHLQECRRALALILEELRFEHVPEVGINFAYALPGATDARRDVAGLAGRITIAGFDRDQTGHIAFGGPHHTGRIAVVLQEYDRSARIVMNHRYDPRFVEAARRAGLVVASFRRQDEPVDAPSSMEWGVRYAIAQNDGRVPDLVWDAGGPGKEAMIRVIAHDPDDLRRKLRAMHGDPPDPVLPASSSAPSGQNVPRRIQGGDAATDALGHGP